MKTIKLIIAVGIITLCLPSCSPVLIGDVTQVSTRNMDSKITYVLLKSYAGYMPAQLRKMKAVKLQEAIDNTVQSVAGGEYLMNAKIYLVSNGYYAVQGDVWGVEQKDVSYNGFKLKDSVTYHYAVVGTHVGKWRKGTIMAFKDANTCLVKWDDNGKTSEIEYKDLTKTNQ